MFRCIGTPFLFSLKEIQYHHFVKHLFFLSIFSFSVVVAQPLMMERYTVENGLSQNLITTMAQDNHGFLWFGTKDGLNRFDGYSFRIFRSSLLDSTSLQSNFISALLVDSAGALWVGTSGGGLSRYNEQLENFTTWRHNVNDSTSIQSDYINGILIGPKGFPIISSVDNGISLFDTTTNSFSRILPFSEIPMPERSVRANIFDPDSTVWIGTEYHGLYTYHFPTKVLRHYPSNKGIYGPSDKRVKYIHRDSKGKYWIAHEFGFDEFDIQRQTFQYHKIIVGKNIATGVEIREISGDEYFINIYSHCGTYNVRTKQFVPIVGELGIPMTYTDRSEMLWISAGGNGILKYNRQLERFHLRRESFWDGLYGEGIEQAKRAARVPSNSSIDRNTLLLQQDSVLWFEVYLDKLIRWDMNNYHLSIFPFNDSFRGIRLDKLSRMFVDNTNTVWGSHGFYLYKFILDKNRFVEFSLSHLIKDNIPLTNKTGYSSITSLFKDTNGIIWLGTPSSGLLRFDERLKTVEQFTTNPKDKHSLSSPFVLSIHDDPNDRTVLWVGTDGGGLNRFDTKNGTVTHRFTSANILPNDVIYAICSDAKKNLWMSSNNGIFCFDPATMNIIAQYDANDGLQSNEFNRYESWKDRFGKLYFGGVGGWNSFYPEQIEQRTFVPEIVLTDLKIMNHSVVHPDLLPPLRASLQTTKEILLQPDQNMISIEFASLDYASPKKNRYRYMLEGLNEEWIDAGNQRTATYTNLDAGSYRFIVQGTNSDGVWSTKQATMEIVVLPPFYKTWWFQSGLIFGFALAITMIVRARFVRLQKEQELQQKFSRQVLEQQEQDRERIAAELHDSLGQNLLVVKNRAILGSQSITENENAKDHFENISTIISDTLKEVRFISHNLRPYQLDSLGLSETVRSTIKKLSESTPLEIASKIDDIDDCLPKEQEINFFRIVQECFNNIIKHSDAKKAEIIVERRSKDIYIKIMDDGKGISDHTSSDKGFGMMGMRERVKMLHGKISINSQPEKGTTIFIEIPI